MPPTRMDVRCESRTKLLVRKSEGKESTALEGFVELVFGETALDRVGEEELVVVVEDAARLAEGTFDDGAAALSELVSGEEAATEGGLSGPDRYMSERIVRLTA